MRSVLGSGGTAKVEAVVSKELRMVLERVILLGLTTFSLSQDFLTSKRASSARCLPGSTSSPSNPYHTLDAIWISLQCTT